MSLAVDPPAAAPALPGEVEWGGQKLPVRLTLAGSVSLFASFPEAVAAPPDGAVFPALSVTLEHGTFALTRCRLHRDAAGSGASGRLVFLDDVYDCRSLFRSGRVDELRAMFQPLSLVLEQRARIHPPFREYVADLLYDLCAYRRLFREHDRVFLLEPEHVAEAAQQVAVDREGPGLFRFLDDRLTALDALVSGFSSDEYERHGFYFRRLLWDFICASEFLRRTNQKPRGYAGDAEMMVMIYENRPLGGSSFDKLLHRHPLATPAAQAVRLRPALVADGFRKARADFPGDGFRVFSVAAGPFWELPQLMEREADLYACRVTLLDQDPFALLRARETVRKLQAARGQSLQVDYLNRSVRTILRPGADQTARGPFQFIYSMGLFDYLSPPVARALLGSLYALLAPGGRLLVGNYHVGNPTRHYMAYWMDWVLYHRTEAQFLELCEDLPNADAELQFDPSGCQMFLGVKKRA